MHPYILDHQLNAMAQTMGDVVTRLNQKAKEQIDPSNVVSQILTILNAHYASLRWIDRQTVAVRSEVASVQQRLRIEGEAQTRRSQMLVGSNADGY